MIEIAISLAIIGFALVAIIGVLPQGMNVQKENREQTMVNFDAAFLMDLIRSGSRGQDDLPNFVNYISITSTLYSNGVPGSTTSVTNVPLGSTIPGGIPSLTSGSNVVGLLSTPKFTAASTNAYFSNVVTGDIRPLTASAVDQGASTNSRSFAFHYLVNVEVLPTANYPYASPDKNWANFSAPGLILPAAGGTPTDAAVAGNLQANYTQLRLRFRWPVLPNGTLGTGRQSYRGAASGSMIVTNPVGLPATRLYFIKPQSFVEVQ